MRGAGGDPKASPNGFERTNRKELSFVISGFIPESMSIFELQIQMSKGVVPGDPAHYPHAASGWKA